MKPEGLGGLANPAPSQNAAVSKVPLMRLTGRSICFAKCWCQQVAEQSLTKTDVMFNVTVTSFLWGLKLKLMRDKDI